VRLTSSRVTWLFLRILGFVYFVAFVSFAVQAIGLIGHDGILPAQLYMDRARAFVASEHIGLDRYRLLPTLCWISASDGFLRMLCWGGATLAVLLIAGVAPIPVLLLLWIDYLSLSAVSREFLSYQWDALLLEAGLIAVFIAPPVLRERRGASLDPSRIGRWLMLWLMFRLMVGSGAVKLSSGDPTWRNLTALTFHYETQPIPTPLAWYAYRLPLWFQKASTAVVLAIELMAPWCVFGSRRWRIAGFTLLAALQLLIALTGNYAFFNILSVALCLFLLDDGAFYWSARLSAERSSGRSPKGLALQRTATVSFAIVTVPISLMMFLGSLGIGFAPPLVGELADFISPLRSVNSYGLFAVMTTTRDEIVIEGSNDAVTWTEYEFPYKPGDLDRRPPWVAPHQPRLDWQMWFASLTTYDNAPWFQTFCRRLLDGSPEVLRLLARNPFPDRPPTYIRGVLYRYHFAGGDTGTGFLETRGNLSPTAETCPRCWWTRERLGDYSPVIH
jgi:lipase maturation factor 1